MKFFWAPILVLLVLVITVRYGKVVLDQFMYLFNYSGDQPNVTPAGFHSILIASDKTVGDVVLTIIGLTVAYYTFQTNRQATEAAKKSAEIAELARKSSLIALEEFRPIIEIRGAEYGDVRLFNSGCFDAMDIRMYKKTAPESSVSNVAIGFDYLGHKILTEKIDLGTHNKVDIFITYRNAASGKAYLVAGTLLTGGNVESIKEDSNANAVAYRETVVYASLGNQILLEKFCVENLESLILAL